MLHSACQPEIGWTLIPLWVTVPGGKKGQLGGSGEERGGRPTSRVKGTESPHGHIFPKAALIKVHSAHPLGPSRQGRGVGWVFEVSSRRTVWGDYSPRFPSQCSVATRDTKSELKFVELNSSSLSLARLWFRAKSRKLNQ